MKCCLLCQRRDTLPVDARRPRHADVVVDGRSPSATAVGAEHGGRIQANRPPALPAHTRYADAPPADARLYDAISRLMSAVMPMRCRRLRFRRLPPPPGLPPRDAAPLPAAVSEMASIASAFTARLEGRRRGDISSAARHARRSARRRRLAPPLYAISRRAATAMSAPRR